MTFKVSQSKVKTFQMCRLAYFYKYVEKLKKKKKSRPLKFGTLIHSMLEEHAKGKDPFSVLDNIPLKEMRLFASEREMYGDIITDIRLIMKDYFKYYEDDGLVAVKKKGVAAEHEFLLNIGGGISITGKIDQISKTPDKLRWMTDHKTFGKAPPHPDHMWRNLQSSVYIKVLDIMGWKPVDGVLWNYIRSKPPTRPLIKKNGDVSTKKMDTLPSAIRYTLKNAGLDPRDFKVMLSSAKQNRKRYFQRFFLPVDHEVVDNIYNGFIDTAREIADNHGKDKTRHFGRHCEWCEFEPLCRAELTGADVDFIKEKDYHVEKTEEVVIEGIEEE